MNDEVVQKENVPKFYVSWEHLEYLVAKVALQIDSKKYTGIYGLPRGGLIPAVMISHQTGIPYAESITEKTLIVDDIIDSGNTLEKYKEYDKVTLISRHMQESKVIATGMIEKSNIWFVFPWEK
ncbi:MAG TPA: hypothetical protein VEC16_01865 [Alphaproteobacteria bacterium]|nr:hypothetical protein [Alphaproteobacteria bacterium]